MIVSESVMCLSCLSSVQRWEWVASHSLTQPVMNYCVILDIQQSHFFFSCFISTGTWDVHVTTSDISSSSMNPKMPLTVCGEKGTCTSVIFPKGSLKKEQIYEISIELRILILYSKFS